MKQKIIVITLLILSINILNAQSFSNLSEKNLNDDRNTVNEFFKIPRFDSRRITGLAYSTFIPGSGQIYLGHKTKGSTFAVGFFVGLVGAIVSQNNFIGNKERIQNLQFEYLNADRYTLAEYLWKQMISVRDEQKTHEKARNIFTFATALVWTLNLVDYLFLTDDKGPIEFSNNNNLKDSYTIFSIVVPLNK